MDIVKLRILTRRSYLGFGKFCDYRVGEVIDNFKGKSYLRWAYFNCSNISFIDNILDEIDIPEPWRIEKPGVNPELYDNVKDCLSMIPFNFKFKSHLDKVNRAKKKYKKDRLDRFERKLQNKYYLQQKNQGKC